MVRPGQTRGQQTPAVTRTARGALSLVFTWPPYGTRHLCVTVVCSRPRADFFLRWSVARRTAFAQRLRIFSGGNRDSDPSQQQALCGVGAPSAGDDAYAPHGPHVCVELRELRAALVQGSRVAALSPGRSVSGHVPLAPEPEKPSALLPSGHARSGRRRQGSEMRGHSGSLCTVFGSLSALRSSGRLTALVPPESNVECL